MDFYDTIISDFEKLEKEDFLSGNDLRVIAKQLEAFEGKLQCANVKVEEYLKIYFIRKKFACFRKEKDGEIFVEYRCTQGKHKENFSYFSALYTEEL